MTDSLTRLRGIDENVGAARQRFERNVSHLESIWDNALQQHPDEWVVVYGDRCVEYGADPDELLGRVPAAQRGAAVSRFLTQPPRTLVL